MRPLKPAKANRRFLFLLASSRSDGNTEILAHQAATSLPLEFHQRWLSLAELPLTPFRDLRHSTETYDTPDGNEQTLLTETLAATDIVFAAPTYWYNLPASAKLYLDYWLKWMQLPNLQFQEQMSGKHMWVITVQAGANASEDWGVEPLINSLRYSADFMKMAWGGVLIGHANRPGEIAKDTVAFEEAKRFFQLEMAFRY
jgi:multimeric flavodoxin WrbA